MAPPHHHKACPQLRGSGLPASPAGNQVDQARPQPRRGGADGWTREASPIQLMWPCPVAEPSGRTPAGDMSRLTKLLNINMLRRHRSLRQAHLLLCPRRMPPSPVAHLHVRRQEGPRTHPQRLGQARPPAVKIGRDLKQALAKLLTPNRLAAREAAARGRGQRDDGFND